MRVLLVEDDVELARRLREALEEAGFAVDVAHDGEDGLFIGETNALDAAILDLGLPKLSGMEVLRKWRAGGRNFPILVLTARGAWTERVEGLNAGADDYMGKPFQAAEVVARIRALVRRSAGKAAAVLTHGDIVLDPGASSVTIGGAPVEITARELRILAYLMHRPGRIVSQSELIDHVYSMEESRESNTIEVYIARLRKKIGHDRIKTLRGLGYRLG
jgi:DNA-binding response OmpR family regulator